MSAATAAAAAVTEDPDICISDLEVIVARKRAFKNKVIPYPPPSLTPIKRPASSPPKDFRQNKKKDQRKSPSKKNFEMAETTRTAAIGISAAISKIEKACNENDCTMDFRNSVTEFCKILGSTVEDMLVRLDKIEDDNKATKTETQRDQQQMRAEQISTRRTEELKDGQKNIKIFNIRLDKDNDGYAKRDRVMENLVTTLKEKGPGVESYLGKATVSAIGKVKRNSDGIETAPVVVTFESESTAFQFQKSARENGLRTANHYASETYNVLTNLREQYERHAPEFWWLVRPNRFCNKIVVKQKYKEHNQGTEWSHIETVNIPFSEKEFKLTNFQPFLSKEIKSPY